MTGRSEKKSGKDDKRVEELELRLAEAEKKAEDFLDVARRLQADFDNYRKRAQRENEEFRKYASEGVIIDMLGIIDDLDRALDHADMSTDLAIGVKSVRQNMMKVLESRGLTEIPTDRRFDPNFHEALCAEEADLEGEIREVFQKGYCIGPHVVRYSKVKVTKKKENSEQECEQSCQE